MKTQTKWISRTAVVVLAGLLAVTIGSGLVNGQADHVRWDIISLTFTPPSTVILNPDGVAFAFARNPGTLKIKLTGSGTFVAPASGGPSSAVTGGGTWETFRNCPASCESTGSGTYWVTRLASWEFANFGHTDVFQVIDNIGPKQANGNAILRIQYSDGSSGTLGIGCHGFGAPDGIIEGVIATKDYLTYWDAEAPGALTVDKNRTSFHIQ